MVTGGSAAGKKPNDREERGVVTAAEWWVGQRSHSIKATGDRRKERCRLLNLGQRCC